jgi:hypothetical protein
VHLDDGDGDRQLQRLVVMQRDIAKADHPLEQVGVIGPSRATPAVLAGGVCYG